jgi:hypothetical protein
LARLEEESLANQRVLDDKEKDLKSAQEQVVVLEAQVSVGFGFFPSATFIFFFSFKFTKMTLKAREKHAKTLPEKKPKS